MHNLNEKKSGINNINSINNNKNKNRTENILGLAKKAGAIISGTELVIDSVRKKKPAMCLSVRTRLSGL